MTKQEATKAVQKKWGKQAGVREFTCTRQADRDHCSVWTRHQDGCPGGVIQYDAWHYKVIGGLFQVQVHAYGASWAEAVSELMAGRGSFGG